MGRYFFLLQGEKRRRCKASTRLFNAAEGKKNNQRNVSKVEIITFRFEAVHFRNFISLYSKMSCRAIDAYFFDN